MFKKSLLVLGVCATLFVSGCSKGDSQNANANTKENVKLVVGATPEPHAKMLQQVVPLLQKEGITLEIKEFNDYVTPNLSLNDGSLDANFFQHKPYLDSFNKEKNTKLVSIGNVHLEPMGVYSKKIKSLEELQNGDEVTLPNDPSNGARALRVLEANGVIKLKKGIELASIQDIVENPKNLKFKEMDAPLLPRTLEDATLSVINTNFALLAGLNPLNDALVLEDKESPYANILVVKEERANDENLKKLLKALQSQAMKDFILNEYKGEILPAF